MTFRCMVVLVFFGLISLVARPAERLQDVKSVFVAPQSDNGDGTLATAVRDKLIAALVKDGVPVTESSDDADCTVTGSYSVQIIARTMHVQASMRLVAQGGKVLWADTIGSTVVFGSASSVIANKIAQKLADAMQAGRR